MQYARSLEKLSSSQAPVRVGPSKKLEPGSWSIGIYAGHSPLQLAPLPKIINPVLTAWDVKDIPAQYVADPFMLQSGSSWYMFFQVMNAATRCGEIGLATSRNGLSWQYQQIVLHESFGMSFPCVFRWNDDFYMIPETAQAGAIRLYRAVAFPRQWEFVRNLTEGKYADPSVFFFQKRWWMFACPSTQEHNVLCLYYSDSPTGKWVQHPRSPVVAGNNRIARPGGRVLPWNGSLIRFAQDCYPTYGKQVRAFRITELTPTTYREEEAPESPILGATGNGWNGFGMHHIDIHYAGNSRWLACVDAIS